MQGIAKGFVVNTPEGYKPIEAFKAGDLVLSTAPGSPGKPQAKRVVDVRNHDDRTLRAFNTYIAESPGSLRFVAATEGKAFWVEGKGWTALGDVRRLDNVGLVEGSAGVDSNFPVFRTQQAGVGWVQQSDDWKTSVGTLFDYANGDLVAQGDPTYLPRGIAEADERYLRVSVYDLVVEDFNTYFVSDHWVRGAEAKQ